MPRSPAVVAAALAAFAVILLAAGCGAGGDAVTSAPTTTPRLATAAPVATSTSPRATATLPAPPTAPTTSPTTGAPRPDARLAALAEVQRSYGAPGALALVVDGDERWQGAVGDADLAGNPVAPNMTFRIASITKPIMGVLALRAVAAGLVGLDDPVAPHVVALRPDPPVTLRQLLSHTAGIFDEGNDGDVVADALAIQDPAWRAEAQALVQQALAGERVVAPAHLIVAAAETHDRYFLPGHGYHYSNTGYQVVGLFLEQLHGRPLAEILASEVVAPLGLEHTTLAPADPSSPALRGHDLPADGTPVDVTDDLVLFGNGANGGVVTTAPELMATFQGVMKGTLLDPAAVDELVAPVRWGSGDSSYGLGFATYNLTCGTFLGHEGGVNGTASIAMVDRAGDRGVVVALNGRGSGDPRLPALADRLLCGG